MFSICKLNRLTRLFKGQRIFVESMGSVTVGEETRTYQENSEQTDPKNNLAAVLYGVNDLRLEQRVLPKLNANDVLVAVDCVGLCKDDIQLYEKGGIGCVEIQQPLVVAHEASGIVLEVGTQVHHLIKGDRVAIEPGLPCRNCQLCRSGRYNLCNDMKFCGTPPATDGILIRYYKHDANFCLKLPSHVTMEEGALLQSLAQGVATCRRAKIGLGSEVVILGCDVVALATLLTAQSMGAAKLLIADNNMDCLTQAQTYGVSTFQLLDNYNPPQVAQQIHDYLNGMPDTCIDCIGSETSVKLGIHVTRPGGTCAVQQAVLDDHIELPLRLAVTKEVDIIGVNRYCNDYPLALAIMASGKLNLKSLITHHFDIEDTLLAFQLAQQKQENAQKIMIHIQPRNTNNFI